MLSPQATATVLVMKPSLNHLIATYKRHADYLMSFHYNKGGISANVIFDLLGEINKKMEALRVFRNVVSVEYSHLVKRDKEVIKYLFFNGYDCKQVMKKMDMTAPIFDVYVRRAFKKFSDTVCILGFDDERLIKYFNLEPLFIDSARIAVKRFFEEGSNGAKID